MKLHKKSLHLINFPVGSYQCNCSILYSDQTREALIIDPGNAHEVVLKKIKELNLVVKKLIHTHAHFDHIGKSSEIAVATGALLYLHLEDEFLYRALPAQGMFFGQIVGTPKPLDHHLEDGMEFEFEDPEIKKFLTTMHTPGHTPGSCCFYTEYFDLPYLFSGDTLFKRSIGRSDLPGGNGETLIKSIKKKIFLLPDGTEVIPGHGDSTRLYEEKKYNPFLC